jgi:hypothetical protein
MSFLFKKCHFLFIFHVKTHKKMQKHLKNKHFCMKLSWGVALLSTIPAMKGGFFTKN